MGNQDQYTTVLNGASAASSISPSFRIEDGVKQGSVMVTTSSTYNGTTGTIALKGSNDNSNFQTVLQNDGTTPMSITMATGANNNTFEIERVLYKYYQIVYTKGDATLGTLTGNFNGKI